VCTFQWILRLSNPRFRHVAPACPWQ
jgi:hypothetical protein